MFVRFTSSGLRCTPTFLLSGLLVAALAGCGQHQEAASTPADPATTATVQADKPVDDADEMPTSGTTAAPKAAATAETNSTDCDAFLKGYEEYVTEYAALAKQMQANPTDTEVMTKYSEMAQKASEWSGKAKGCENDPAFQNKYLALTAKIAAGMTQAQ